VLLSSLFQILNGMPHLLILDINSQSIGLVFSSHLVPRVRLSCAIAVAIKLRVNTSVILRSKCSSSGIIWSGSMWSNGKFLQPYSFFSWSFMILSSVLLHLTKYSVSCTSVSHLKNFYYYFVSVCVGVYDYLLTSLTLHHTQSYVAVEFFNPINNKSI